MGHYKGVHCVSEYVFQAVQANLIDDHGVATAALQQDPS
jgi:hypothetical protein